MPEPDALGLPIKWENYDNGKEAASFKNIAGVSE